jgi:hypothetical protein
MHTGLYPFMVECAGICRCKSRPEETGRTHINRSRPARWQNRNKKKERERERETKRCGDANDPGNRPHQPTTTPRLERSTPSPHLLAPLYLLFLPSSGIDQQQRHYRLKASVLSFFSPPAYRRARCIFAAEAAVIHEHGYGRHVAFATAWPCSSPVRFAWVHGLGPVR